MTLPPWSMHSVENTAMMGLQATTATKRKYEIGACGNAGDVQANCTPAKAGRWSTSTTSAAAAPAVPAPIVAITTEATTTPITADSDVQHTDNNNSTNDDNIVATTTNATAVTVASNNSTLNNNNNIDDDTTKRPQVVDTVDTITATPPSTIATTSSTNTCTPALDSVIIAHTVNHTVTTGDLTPLTTLCSSSSDTLSKMEAASVEAWHNAEPIVDSISRLQAVAVPDTWGSASDLAGTRSALATTLMHADDLDDDDEDFEDDFDEEESIIPSYSPMRYPCTPPPPGSNRTTNTSSNYNMASSASSTGYGKPSYYSEPYPQQNCSRTPTQYARQPPTGHYGWSGSNNGGYYVPPEAAHPHSQQTIRCAENGKSYLELGSSNYSPVPAPPIPVDPRAIHPAAPSPPKRCCCDGRNSWCANKQCYRDRRLKMRNLSMFKLSRFRQVSEQSLYRSVLICNTLKNIDREMELEAKQSPPELHHHHHHYNNHPRMAASSLPPPPPPPPTNNNDQQHMHCPPAPLNHQYSVIGDNGQQYHQQSLPQHHQQHQQHHHHHQPQQQHQPQHQQPPHNHHHHQMHQHQPQHHSYVSNPQQILPHQSNNNNMSLRVPPLLPHQHQPSAPHQPHQPPTPIVPSILTFNETQPPYDHHPLKEHQTGRATPFPSCLPLETDSGYGDEDCMRPINWGSVLSLSSQSALDPLNNNDLFTPSTSSSIISSSSSSSSSPMSLSSSMPSFVTVTSTVTPATNWEYNLLDMDLGLGPELTELLPSWKLTPLSADDILKSVPPPMEPSRILMDTDMDQLTHIMVGS